MGLTTDEMLLLFDHRLAELKRAEGSTARHPMWIDNRTLFEAENDESWLVRDVWPSFRQVHVHAARKTGKSLVSLHMATSLAKGRDPFTGAEQEPVKVGYLDYEMGVSDVSERLADMGTVCEEIDQNFYYAMHPVLPMMDTKAGGETLIERLTAEGIQCVILDTFSRVVAGEENSNDTYRAFFRWTGALLKAAGVAMWRLDHEGHLEGRSRGGSAKADDVDVVWQLKRVDGGLQFVRQASRVAWVPEKVTIREGDNPLAFYRTSDVIIPDGTMAVVAMLDETGVPIDASMRTARQMLIEAGLTPGKNAVFRAAVNHRKNRVLGL